MFKVIGDNKFLEYKNNTFVDGSDIIGIDLAMELFFRTYYTFEVTDIEFKKKEVESFISKISEDFEIDSMEFYISNGKTPLRTKVTVGNYLMVKYSTKLQDISVSYPYTQVGRYMMYILHKTDFKGNSDFNIPMFNKNVVKKFEDLGFNFNTFYFKIKLKKESKYYISKKKDCV